MNSALPQSALIKISFLPALEKLGLKEEFITLARAGASNTELRAWAMRQPVLAGIAEIPQSLRSVRRTLQCSAPAGGSRAGCNAQKFYRVSRAS